MVTGDALFTHRDVAEEIRRRGGDFLLIVQDNQPELKAPIQAAWHDDADFSPLPTQAEGSPGTNGPKQRQGAWTPRTASADQHHLFERLSGLAGCGAGV